MPAPLSAYFASQWPGRASRGQTGSLLHVRGFAADEDRESIDGVEVLHVQIFVGDGDRKTLLQPGHQLHGEQRIHKTQSENIVTVFQGGGPKKTGQKRPDFYFCLFHSGSAPCAGKVRLRLRISCKSPGRTSVL